MRRLLFPIFGLVSVISIATLSTGVPPAPSVALVLLILAVLLTTATRRVDDDAGGGDRHPRIVDDTHDLSAGRRLWRTAVTWLTNAAAGAVGLARRRPSAA